MKKFIPCLFLIFIFVHNSFSFSKAVSFLKEGVSAREIAMGGTGVAGIEGVNSIYWNPAGLNNMDAYLWQISTLWSFETYDRYYAYIGIAKYTDEYGSFGVSFINYGVKNIEIYDENGVLTSNEDDSEYVLTLSYANKINYQLKYGFSIKGHYQNLIGYKAIGYSFDTGLIFKPFLDKEIYFGIMLQNLMGELFWENYEEDILSLYKGGVCFKLFDEKLVLNFDIVKEEDLDYMKYKLGIEFNIFNYVFIRGGIDYKYPTAGLGISYNNYKFDYSYVYNKNDLGDTHQISLIFMW